MRLDPLRTGCAVGSVFGLWHLAWAALVAFGGAKPLLDFVLWLHFLSLPVAIAPFEMGRAVVLVAFTGSLGGVIGVVFALVWNAMHGDRPAEPAAGEFIGVAVIETTQERIGEA